MALFGKRSNGSGALELHYRPGQVSVSVKVDNRLPTVVTEHRQLPIRHDGISANTGTSTPQFGCVAGAG